MSAEKSALSQLRQRDEAQRDEAQRDEAQRDGILFAAWEKFNGEPRSDIEVTALARIRFYHQACHVTRTTESCFDLFGYAKAGHATATPTNGSPRGYDATREYDPPAGTRMETKGQPGTLTDRVNFGRWSYEWQGNSYVVLPTNPATDALLLAVGAWSRELHDEIEELYASVKGSSWDDVVLEPGPQGRAGRGNVVGFFDNQQVYRSLGVPWKRGVIFHGVPRNGKTAFESGNGPKWSIREIFSHARTMAPCLLIFEDLDSLVDGLESNEGDPDDRVDQPPRSSRHPAIAKRPARFDRKEAYARFWARKFTDDGDRIDFPEMCRLIAKMTDGFSFAYLKELFVTSLLTLARGGGGGEEEEEEEEEKASEDGFPADEMLVETPEKKDCCCAKEKAKKDKKDKKKDKTKPKKQKQKQKRVMPEVEVPDRLKENLLLKIVAAQAKILLEQMNESEEDEEKDSRYMGYPLPQVYDSDEDCEDDGCC
ncbi:putative proteasome-activating nucleotidase [Diplogelasinospora grovesii]|uniref:Proteasome-activating nucleotidase n=1 Tax=Diplogelasinospora grovesii TaxID=303347 RepID=A0AAN6N5Q1_9PEZI|nr:putative proteasome-activating nucleotidase [Diplogelasinospora grovesii]